MSKVVILIPARFASTRFPGKPLSLIHNKSMIQRVYENSLASGFPCYVVTDHDEIQAHVLEFGGKVLRIDDDVPSGSERVALAYERFLDKDTQIIINVQGDEPLLKGEILKDLAQFHLASSFAITTLVKERSSNETDFMSPHVVKAVYSSGSGECLYFSRQALPFCRDQEKVFSWYQHIGVYSYRVEALKQFVTYSQSPLEIQEKLEQLRALENGMRIGAILTKQNLIGVDVPSDIKRVEEELL